MDALSGTAAVVTASLLVAGMLALVLTLAISLRGAKKRSDGYRNERNDLARAFVDVVSTMHPGPDTYELVTLINATQPFNISLPQAR